MSQSCEVQEETSERRPPAGPSGPQEPKVLAPRSEGACFEGRGDKDRSWHRLFRLLRFTPFLTSH